eukprot:2731654-Ditylum_brightwellii.AAC.1
MKAFHWPSLANRQQLQTATNALETQVHIAKSEWARRLTYVCMEYRTDPVKAWKAIRTLEKGLSHHHTKCRT